MKTLYYALQISLGFVAAASFFAALVFLMEGFDLIAQGHDGAHMFSWCGVSVAVMVVAFGFLIFFDKVAGE